MAAIYVKVNGRYVAIPTLKGDTGSGVVTDAFSNLGVGDGALDELTTGSHNTGIGKDALGETKNGHNNAGVGINALGNIIDGTYNVGIGSRAGAFIADGSTPLPHAGNSVFIGYNSRGIDADPNHNQNEIVIGANAIGKGSNTAVIGTNSTTETYLAGTLKNHDGTPMLGVTPTAGNNVKALATMEYVDAAAAGCGTAGIIIADTVDDLPEDAADGTLAIVKAVEQTLQFATYNVDKLLVGENDAYLVGAALPQAFFNRHPPRADFTELGVPEQVLVMGGTGTFSAVKTIWIDNGGQTTERPHLHYAYQVDMYDMMYAPAGILGAVPALVVNDHRLGDLLELDDPPYMRYLYFWDDFYDDEELLFGADTWHEVTAWDEDGQPTAFTEIDGMPSAAESQCHYFGNDAAGEAAKAYFGQIINTAPFENVKFAKIDGVWTRI